MKSKAQDAANTVTEKAKDFGSSVAEKAKDFGSSVADKAKDAASTVADKTKDAASSVAHTAGDVASTVGHKAEDATSAVGNGMTSLAGTIREKAPHEGMLGSASATLADTLESGGRYLQEEGLKGIADDLTNLIKRNPLPALLVGIGLGFLLARATRS
jgi:hypothetical protein